MASGFKSKSNGDPERMMEKGLIQLEVFTSNWALWWQKCEGCLYDEHGRQCQNAVATFMMKQLYLGTALLPHSGEGSGKGTPKIAGLHLT